MTTVGDITSNARFRRTSLHIPKHPPLLVQRVTYAAKSAKSAKSTRSNASPTPHPLWKCPPPPLLPCAPTCPLLRFPVSSPLPFPSPPPGFPPTEEHEALLNGSPWISRDPVMDRGIPFYNAFEDEHCPRWTVLQSISAAPLEGTRTTREGVRSAPVSPAPIYYPAGSASPDYDAILKRPKLDRRPEYTYNELRACIVALRAENAELKRQAQQAQPGAQSRAQRTQRGRPQEGGKGKGHQYGTASYVAAHTPLRLRFEPPKMGDGGGGSSTATSPSATATSPSAT